MTTRYLAALCLAAIYRAPKLSLWQLVKSAVGIAMAFLPFGKKVDEATYTARMTCCEDCQIFFSPLCTCGSPLVDETQGCFCEMSKAARLASKDCWARESGMGFGWAENLRPKT